MVNIDHVALKSQLSRYIQSVNLSISDDKIDKLIAFVLLIHKWNKAYNLSAVREPEQMLVKHIMDALVVSPHVKGQEITDVGTGPGLPGIPLAIVLPEKSFTLIDSLGKRIRFIKQVCFELNIHNVQAIHTRVENLDKGTLFDTVLSRAFASLDDMLNWCAHLVDNQGEFLALKGQLHQDELRNIKGNFIITDTVALNVPNLNAERHLVKIKKR
ncbi:16S rRNA (guanine(527)-N(7))-methyltransferase RsmG [Ningiella sp. W23]|uniref:16S rRNA (guanine(527)-N(7))-methyltransferase RsmG n=1 Tax=Ningiella sp. W23 TaxID=3023715 RepID=UPI0037582F83